MRLRRLGWAGIELEAGGESLVVDHVLDVGILGHFLSDEPDALVTPEPARASGALVTHLHLDHADAAAADAALAPGAPVLTPTPHRQPSALDEAGTGEAQRALAALPRPLVECQPGDTHTVGPFTITAATASDGFGAPQVSWVVEADGRRVLHGGDTLWHGGWWEIALAHGPIDVACLPGNGAEVSYPQWQPPALVPAVMRPTETVEAALALSAGTLVPIHYSATFDHPDFYRPVPDAAEQIRAHAAARGVPVAWLEPGEWVELDALAPTQSAA
jgi:L-ascorbate metabolism protein UlaG (beta-lactamase superfamily)